MSTIGGNIETKEIGFPIGFSGIHNNTEYINGNLQLKVSDKDANNEKIYAEYGEWISDVVDLQDQFYSYEKIFTEHINNGDALFRVQTRVSNDKVSWDSWIDVDMSNGEIYSAMKQYIQIKIIFEAGFRLENFTIYDKENVESVNFVNEVEPNTYIDTSNGIKLKRDYEFDMDKDNNWEDEGSLHRKLITRGEWSRIDKIETNAPPSVVFFDDMSTKNWNRGSISNGQWTDFSGPTTVSARHNTEWQYRKNVSYIIEIHYNIANYNVNYRADITLGLFHIYFHRDSGQYVQVREGNAWKRISVATNGNNIWKLIYNKDKSYEVYKNGALISSGVLSSTPEDTLYVIQNNVNNKRVYIDFISIMKNHSDLKIIKNNGKMLIYNGSWEEVEHLNNIGMDSLSPLLDRKVTELESIEMNADSSWTEDGKLFRKTIDLNKYFDIRSVKVEVE